MKRIISLTGVLLASINFAAAQDVITKKSGDDIQAKVEEITETSVKYKKWSNVNGPTYTISKADVFRIKYQNGDIDMFNDTPGQATTTSQQSTETNKPHLVKKGAAANNPELIAKYAKEHGLLCKFSENDKQKAASDGVAFMKFDDSSILSNEDLEITFRLDESKHPDETVFGYSTNKSKRCLFFRYDIVLKNKTDHIIYVDLANTMRITNLGESYSYYNPDQVSSTIGNGTASGIGLGIGGIGVGFGASKSASLQHSFVNQQVISIPPHATKLLSQFKYATSKNHTSNNWGSYDTPERAEEFNFTKGNTANPMFKALCLGETNIGLKRGVVNKGGTVNYTVDNSPYVARYTILYSNEADFKTYSILTPVLYIYKVMGGESMNWIIPWTKESWILETISNYDTNTIIAPISFDKQ